MFSGLLNLKLHLLHENCDFPDDGLDWVRNWLLLSVAWDLVFSTHSGHNATSESIPLGTYLKLETGTCFLHLSHIVVLFMSNAILCLLISSAYLL